MPGTTHPDGKQFCGEFMIDLYESLLKSVNKKGSTGNFVKNVSLLDSIIKQYYASNTSVNWLCDSLNNQREEFFRPFFDDVFDKDGLSDL